jgi:hypothetical protein
MRWRERSVRGRVIPLRAIFLAWGLGAGFALSQTVIPLVIGLVAAVPATVLYFSIACPRCDDLALWPPSWFPARCQKCGLPTDQPWPTR